MNDQLDRAVRSVLTDIVATAPERDDHPIRTVGVQPRSRVQRPYLMVAAAALALVGVGGVALVNNRDTCTSPASTPAADLPATVATSTPDTPATTVPTPASAPMADLYEQVAHRVAGGEDALAALGFPNNSYAISADGVTEISASDPTRPTERNITILMTPGTPVLPENHDRAPATVVAQTNNLIRVENHSNDGWTFAVELVDTSGGALPTLEQLQDLIYSIDP